ncbi:MAG TPA: sigma 54-interacting transcriptional regulator [Candidatus Binatia bacterium]
MERKNPGSFPDSNQVVAHPERSGTTPKNDSDSIVVVWDQHPFRLQTIQRIVFECGARPRAIDGLSAIDDIAPSLNCTVALVAIGGRPSAADVALNAIRALRQKGFKIISCADGVQSWPLGVQSLPLLAGSSRLLDSATMNFALELRLLLAQLLQAETARHGEDEQIKAKMTELGIVGESQAMISIFRWILRVSVLSDLPILITGQTGTGKQILANAISRLDPKRRNHPFVALNCGAISPTLAESELFGHRRGAFTGADRDRRGLIRSAQGGILFLDEIGELGDPLQTKLLRMLQEKSVLGVGEDQETQVDVRVIAATNRDLDQMVQERKFRADLFHRLNVLSIEVPPLIERPADIKPLIEHFLLKYRFIKPGTTLSVGGDFVEALVQVELPGNVRQLENVVRQVLVNKEDRSPLSLSDLPVEVWRQLSGEAEGRSDSSESLSRKEDSSPLKTPPQDLTTHVLQMLDTNGWRLSRSLEWCERLFLEAALRKARGNQSQTARLLGITSRSVYNKVRKHNLTF